MILPRGDARSTSGLIVVEAELKLVGVEALVFGTHASQAISRVSSFLLYLISHQFYNKYRIIDQG